MRTVVFRWTLIAAAGLALSGCQMFRSIFGGGNAPAAAPSADWRAVATSGDRERLRTYRAAWERALRQARENGHVAELAALGPLADPDVALADPLPPPGSYLCRTIKIGAKSPGMLDYIAYPPFQCAITVEPGSMIGLAKLTGSQRQKGMLWGDTPRQAIFLGTVELGDERMPMPYGTDPDRDVAGVLERVGDRRWRLAMPWPRWESNLDLIELVPAG